jgi:hypothetical protein
MNKSKLIAILFVVLGALVILGSAFVIISYASDMLNAVVDFVSSNDFSKLQQCGITPPSEFQKLKTDLFTMILPSLHIGLPLMLIILSFLMFLGGYYYHKGRDEDEVAKNEMMERDMLRKAVERLESQKVSKPARPKIVEEPEEEEEEEPTKTKKKK